MKRVGKISDFFGIRHLTLKDVAGAAVETKLSTDGLASKFRLLTFPRSCLESKEIVHDRHFGRMRHDHENVIRSHGQFEPDNQNKLFSTHDIKRSYTKSEPKAQDETTTEDDSCETQPTFINSRQLASHLNTLFVPEKTKLHPLEKDVTLDSKGFNDYTHQVTNWDACIREEILGELKKSIIYHNYDVLAINKPYGLASHGGNKKDKLNVNSLLQDLAKTMRIEKVYLAHRLDKTTSGVLLFATSQERADQLNKLFKSDQIKKTYWCITKGVPILHEAIIDIPIGEYEIAGMFRSCLAPEGVDKERQLSKRFREARRAITEYSVIHSNKHVSLVEVKPRTGVKHQIRCHFGFGLNRPILGDHKYSHLGKLAPQELAMPVLNLLHLRQTKVRTLPMHLHAKTIVLPSVKPNGQNLFIEAPLPKHFKENMKTLRLVSRDVEEKL